MGTEADRRFMRRCLTLARRAQGRTSPNPMVGCVVVSLDGHVLAEGWHRRAGESHAERVALEKLGGKAVGASLYVNLEPCAHLSKRRTKPCAPLVAESGIKRLVFGMHDPFPGHGGGLDAIRLAGVDVEGPVEESACRRLNEAFVVYATEKRAHFTLKAAMTLDGRIATASGESRWITGEVARAHGHRLRNAVDAILVGIGTVFADDPLLTTRGVRGGRDPVRVVLDGKLRLPLGAAILNSGSPARTLVATRKDAPLRREHALLAAGVEVLRLPSRGGMVDLGELSRELAHRDILSVLVEGGAATHASFLEAGLCDRLLLYMAPRAIGGDKAPSWLGGRGVLRLDMAHELCFDTPPRRLGRDLLFSATRVRS
ncbi:MAG: bifunctional diaminohydroxyphosphoribosylaminopyrimidine deaminase/5-amino-6-(5-phosphoribosylamino)uracil reductase RibD [Deltaproteobacteria bacterium]|nr:bifunctional diaminohydroxyphosphoribosylaminopyrimidine deaminase/5-amino-6-(5-phosphoribosylamino)uracil reductase RibD [Deltaproteobacteria bacterium]